MKNKDTERLNWMQIKTPTVVIGRYSCLIRVHQNLHHNQQEIVGTGKTLRQAIDMAMKIEKGASK